MKLRQRINFDILEVFFLAYYFFLTEITPKDIKILSLVIKYHILKTDTN